MGRFDNMKKKKIIILKLGSAVLTNGGDRISRDKIDDIASQIFELKDKYHIVLVSSGAIATAKQTVTIANWNKKVTSKQALAAIGQPRLMQQYFEIFRDYQLNIAQCLLTYNDIDNPDSGKNTLNTIMELIQHDFIPIVNENDTVAIDEIVMGDNDKLSAKLSVLLDVEMLILATDIDGLFDKNPHLHNDAKLIDEIHDIKNLKDYVEEKSEGLGRGGMTSKVEAASLCFENNINTIITNGHRKRFIIDSIENVVPCTRFVVDR